MRLGGPVFGKHDSPDTWAALVGKAGYRSAYCPIGPDADDRTVAAYAKAAADADIVIAEVGAWSNPLSPQEDERKAALEKCKAGLALADRIGARCCVNISGSRGAKWDGPDSRDLTPETFDMIVATTREIIDAVKPAHAFWTQEGMPWMYPDSPDSTLDLRRAVDRPAFAVHLDPVNWISSPQRYFANGQFIKECFAKLGPWIKSCHAKDICLRDKLTVHLDECIPGDGGLEYAVYLKELAKLDPDIPLLLEHLDKEEEYLKGAKFIRTAATAAGIDLAR